MKPRLFLRGAVLALALGVPAQAVAQEAPAAPDTAVPGTPPQNWWHLDEAADRFPGISLERAYAELLAGKKPARPVVVAIIDSGIDIEHEDLDDVLWVNEDEVPGNGVDDDGNGYVDDVHGWNFIGGPDGRHVVQDTYELTRLYARYSRLYEGARPDTLSAAARAEYEEYTKIREDFEARRAEVEEQIAQVRGMDEAVDRFVALLKENLGTDTLTAEKVAGVKSLRMDVMQARQAFLQLAAAGITPQMIEDEVERLEAHRAHGLNPDFDPRHIVGDDYDDPADRFYGNADVEGPDAMHGTHVAGIAAAERGNALGVDGVASAARIMVIRAVPDGDERDKDVANAIRYAVDNGAKVVNMSFGKGYSPEKSLVDEAVRYAEERGVILVHAAGNDAADLTTEPNFPNRFYADGGEARLWIEVGASSWEAPEGLAASFSNYGRGKVDVFAPGALIYSSVPQSEYQNSQGTSMAAPVVTGLAALVMAYYPELSPAEVKAVILDSATRYPGEVLRPGAEEGERIGFPELSTSGGIVNAYAALRLAEERAAAKRN